MSPLPILLCTLLSSTAALASAEDAPPTGPAASGADGIEALRRAGELDKALATFRNTYSPTARDEELLGALHRVLIDPKLVANDETRWAREVLRCRAQSASATLAQPAERGDPIVVSGHVRDASDRPVGGALLYVFHADDAGRYTPARAMDEPNARLFAFLRTGSDGRFEFKTIYPGPYPERKDVEGDARFVPRHVHFEITADGIATRRGQMVFDDDPRMTPYWHEWARKGEHPIAHVTRATDRGRLCSCDLMIHAK